jgi:hypothetical protein
VGTTIFVTHEFDWKLRQDKKQHPLSSNQFSLTNANVRQMTDVVAIRSKHDAGPHFPEPDEFWRDR